jgi:hypothetical protein
VSVLSARLIRLIEEHAEQLTSRVLADLASNPRTTTFSRMSREELHRRVYDVYHNLGRWIGDKTDEQLEATYGGLGGARYNEGIPLSELVYVLVLVKDHLREYIRAVGLVDSAVELYLEEELHLSIGHFFDKAVYFTVKGYESAAAAEAREPRTA